MARKKSISKQDFRVTETRSADGRVVKHAAPPDYRGFWWTAPSGLLHSSVWSTVDQIHRQQDRRRKANVLHERLYGDEDIASLNRALEERVTMNIIEMAVDTLGAKISKQKPKTAFVTDGGDWGQQRRAKRLDKYVEGIKARNKTTELARDEFRDACVKDIGVEKWFLEPDGKICAERVLPEELLVDAVDGQYGKPRCVYQVKAVHREVLRAELDAAQKAGRLTKERHAELLDAVERADEPREDLASLRETKETNPEAIGDMVEVREAWHLPSHPVKPGPKAPQTDGRHVVCISTATLTDEPWTRPDFPFVVTYFGKRLRGFYGRGVAARLVRWQRTINKKLRRLDKALDLMAIPRTWVRRGSGVNPRMLSNEMGAVGEYDTEPPVFQNPPSVGQELIQSIETDARRALEAVGVSMMDVAARKPGGIDSGVALREFNDIASERFILVGQGYEEADVERSRQIIALSREAAAKGAPLEVMVESRGGGLERISWKDVALDEEQFVLKSLPTSSLPTTMAARKQTVTEWLDMGIIDALTWRRLMDLPDLEASNSIAFAGQEDVEWALEDLLDGKDYEAPEPYMDLAYGVKRFQSAYLRARRQGAPEEVLSNLRAWISQAEQMLASIQPAAPAPAPVAPGAPSLPPGPAPAGPPLAV